MIKVSVTSSILVLLFTSHLAFLQALRNTSEISVSSVIDSQLLLNATTVTPTTVPQAREEYFPPTCPLKFSCTKDAITRHFKGMILMVMRHIATVIEIVWRFRIVAQTLRSCAIRSQWTQGFHSARITIIPVWNYPLSLVRKKAYTWSQLVQLTGMEMRTCAPNVWQD